MKTFSVLTLVILLSATNLFSGTLSVLPMKPKVDTDVSIEFKPSKDQIDWVRSASNFHAVVFEFTAESDIPNAVEVALEEDGKRWTGEYTVPADVVYAMIKVGDGRRYDTHRDLYWEFNVYTAENKPVKSSKMRQALTWIGNLPKSCNRKADQLEAMQLMGDEISVYPDNRIAKVNEIYLQLSTKSLSTSTATAEMQAITNNPTYSDPLEAMAVIQAFRGQGKNDEAQAMMDAASKQFPQSRLAEQRDLDALRSVQGAPALAEAVEAHLKKYPESFVRQNLIDMVVNATTKQGSLVELISFLKSVQKVPASSYHASTNYIGARDSLRGDALVLIEMGLEAADDNDRRPAHISQHQWDEEQRIASSQLLFVKGAILDAEGKTKEAMDAYERSLEIGKEQSDKGVYARYAMALEAAGRTDEALKIAKDASRYGASSQTTTDIARRLMSETGASEAQIDQEMKSLQDQAGSLIAERLANERLNQPLIDGTFTDREGNPVKISDWTGKVVVLDYWATWCGPCRKSFPSMQKLYERYKDHPRVEFAIVNVWERVDDKKKHVEEFLQKNPTLTFPVYFDETDAVVRKYGVTGIPTKFYLGPDGRVQFKEVGYLPEEQFLIEATNKIEALLSLQ